MRNSIAALITCVALFAGLPVRGDEGNQKTTLTFSQPVELPGVVLPAGKYVFKLIWGNTYRNVIQVSNAEETKRFATLLAIPDYRLRPTTDTVIRFAERPVNRPKAIRGWFYPGMEFGHEFVYASEIGRNRRPNARWLFSSRPGRSNCSYIGGRFGFAFRLPITFGRKGSER